LKHHIGSTYHNIVKFRKKSKLYEQIVSAAGVESDASLKPVARMTTA
jgi:hypothetical protein